MNLMNLFNSINTKEILRKLPDAVIIVSSDGKINWTNIEAELLFNIAKNDDEKEEFFLDDFVNKGLEQVVQSAIKHVPVIAGACSCDDKEFFIELNAIQMDDDFIITIRDVTAMTKVLTNAEKTGRLNKDKNVMLTKLAHDFKSPLQSIIGFSQALSDGLGGEINEKQDKYVKIINKNATELLYFMDKFFEFSKAESSLVKFEIQTFDVINSVQELLKSNEQSFSAKNLNIGLDFETLARRTVTTDESALKTILQNIIEVSLKLTEIGSINIKLANPDMDLVLKSGIKVINKSEDTSYILISITDTGMGLQEIEFDGLFEPYTQIEKQNKKNFVRTVSLGTAKNLANRLNGTIWAESEVMKGTTFNVILPIEKGIILEDE